MPEAIDLSALRGFILDLDGVIYRGNSVIPGAPAFIAGLRRAALPYLYLTNNSTTPPVAVAERLIGMGIQADPEEVMTSAEATAAILKAEMPTARVLVVGETGVKGALRAAGFHLVREHDNADVVVVGMDRRLTYDKLREAALAIRRGAAFIATNPDRTLPTEHGLIPGAGSLVGALEIATDRKARVIGKPSPDIFLKALERINTPPQLTAVVGDRPDTDIAGGHRAGLRTIGLLSGAGTQATFAELRPPPDWVFEDVASLESALFSGRAGN